MPTTRSSARKEMQSSPQAGDKRKAGAREEAPGATASKAIKKDSKKRQKKIEEVGIKAGQDKEADDTKTGNEDMANCKTDTKPADKASSNPIQASSDRSAEMSSNIVEKGIIYFLTRGRVDTPSPHNVNDLQRSYVVLRPLPLGAKLGSGPIPDDKAARLLAIPKKTLPKGSRERFMAMIEKSKVSMQDLKEQVFRGNEYETQTLGTRKTPAVAPVGEGVYAITVTGRTSHLAYVLSIPEELGEVQKDMGIRSRGSFVLSLKNPTKGGPSYAQLGEKPDFPKSMLEEFGELRWMPVQKPEHLEYPNSQVLLIGEGQEKFAGAVEPEEEHQKNGEKKTPAQELEELGEEEDLRIEHLNGDDSIFDDLHISKKDYPSVMSTW